MTRVMVLRNLICALLWLTIAAGLGVATARYAEARNPHTPVCCPAGTTGHSPRATP